MNAVSGIDTDIEDEELISRIADNDRHALEQLYRRHHVRSLPVYSTFRKQRCHS